MTRIMSDVWQLDLRVVEEEFTLVGVNPVLDDSKELAADLRAKAEGTAHQQGKRLAEAKSARAA
jgi:FMN-dependent NADH-azoreductase